MLRGFLHVVLLSSVSLLAQEFVNLPLLPKLCLDADRQSLTREARKSAQAASLD